MADTNVRLMCPNLTCKKILVVPGSSRGKTVRCKSCSTAIRVPSAPPAGHAHSNSKATEAA